MADFKELMNAPELTDTIDPEDARENRLMGVLAYLSWLVLIPIFAAPNSKFARFHCNQGILLAIVELVCGVVLGLLGKLPLIGWIFSVVEAIIGIAVLVFVIRGIVDAINGRAREIPVVGGIRLFK